MASSAKILADSISPDGVRLTTLEVVFARCVLAEFNTHRMLSRNSASSRAIPFEKMIKRVQEDPYIPAWTRNQKGMSGELLDPNSQEYQQATQHWLVLRDRAIETVLNMGELGVHKQDVNRALEPWMWHTAIVTATEWSNFDHLRDHSKAHPAIQSAAKAMITARAASTPEKLDYGQWHMPLIDEETNAAVCMQMRRGMSLEECRENLVKISVGRCARVSYLTHEGKRDLAKDIELHDTLLGNGHMSPLEHVARPMQQVDAGVFEITHIPSHFSGNFRGWIQYRKTIPNEHDILGSVK